MHATFGLPCDLVNRSPCAYYGNACFSTISDECRCGSAYRACCRVWFAPKSWRYASGVQRTRRHTSAMTAATSMAQRHRCRTCSATNVPLSILVAFHHGSNVKIFIYSLFPALFPTKLAGMSWTKNYQISQSDPLGLARKMLNSTATVRFTLERVSR